MKKKVNKAKSKKVAKKVSKHAPVSIVKKVVKKGIQPFGDRVLIRPFTEDEVKGDKSNHYGIIIPDTVTKEKAAQGKVLAVGEGKFVDGKYVPMRVNVGDIIVFSKYGYDEVEQDGEELYLLKEESILAIIKS